MGYTDTLVAMTTLTVMPYPTPAGTPSLSVAETPPRRRPTARARTASHLREQIRSLVAEAGTTGMTWQEVAEVVERDHGSVSGALSLLQNNGAVVRLRTRRAGNSIYVAPEHAQPEDVAPRRVAKVSQQALDEAREAGRSEGHAAGRSEGFDDGWASGYDDGVEAGRASVPAVTDDTIRTLRREGAEQFRVKILQHTEAMLRATDPLNAGATHSKTCWRTHPACTIRALRAVITSAAA